MNMGLSCEVLGYGGSKQLNIIIVQVFELNIISEHSLKEYDK